MFKEFIPSDWNDDQIVQVSLRWKNSGCGQRTARRSKNGHLYSSLRHDFPIAVVKQKEFRHAADGLLQAKAYAEILGLKFACYERQEIIDLIS
jgi:hypothetical protein